MNMARKTWLGLLGSLARRHGRERASNRAATAAPTLERAKMMGAISKGATNTIPVVFVSGEDAVKIGLELLDRSDYSDNLQVFSFILNPTVRIRWCKWSLHERPSHTSEADARCLPQEPNSSLASRPLQSVKFLPVEPPLNFGTRTLVPRLAILRHPTTASFNFSPLQTRISRSGPHMVGSMATSDMLSRLEND